MAWKIAGSYFETCSCDVVCPCTTSLSYTPKVMTDGNWRTGFFIDATASDEDGLKHSVRIGDAVDFEIEDIVPFGVESGQPAKLVGIFHPAGPDLAVAHATRSRIDAFGISYEGKSAFSRSEFAWEA